MAVDVSREAQAVAVELLAKVSSFLGELWRIPAVHSVGIRSRPNIELWVVLEHDDDAVSKTILRRHWLEFERALEPSVGLHMVSLDHVKPEHLPTFTTIFER